MERKLKKVDIKQQYTKSASSLMVQNAQWTQSWHQGISKSGKDIKQSIKLLKNVLKLQTWGILR